MPNAGYEFKRGFFYDVKASIEQNKATVVLGARKTGKTVCLKQLADELANAVYYDAKTMTDDETIDLVDNVVSSIQNNENKVFLIDETTCLLMPEQMLAQIASAYTDCRNSSTRVVFAGSQSVALEAWAVRAFAGNAAFIYADFLSYPEWLAFKGLNEVSEQTYNQYILGTREFYSDFVSLDAYLKGCLDETVQSNYKTSNIIFHNECDALSVPILKNILYASLISQLDRPSIQSFFNKENLFKKIRFSFKEEFRALGEDIVKDRIDNILSSRMTAYSSMPFDALKQGFVFLQRSGLVTLTYVSEKTNDFEDIIDVTSDLCRWDNNRIKNKEELFSKVNICIKYPMFFVEIIKEILQDHMPEEIKGEILGGVVECQARGLLPIDFSYEYHKEEGLIKREVDYVNYAERKAVEFSIRNKTKSELCFDDLPTEFEKILLTKDQDFTTGGVQHIPYYKFIYEHSVKAQERWTRMSEVKYDPQTHLRAYRPQTCLRTYCFKRSFFYDVEEAILESSVTFLLGARRCGKTVCLQQIKDAFSSAGVFDEVIYVDVKRDFASTADKSLFIHEVKTAISNNEKKLFLIDEATYLNQPDGAIMDVQDAFTLLHNTNTKVVFTGSQSRALEFWGHRAFAGDALFIRTDFLTYPEWLAFKGTTEVSEETYEQFVRGTREFYSNFHSTKEYLQGCLDETVISNLNAEELITNNDCDALDVDKLLDVLYASLVSSHSRENYSTFFKSSHLQETIARYFPQAVSEIGKEALEEEISLYFAERYNNYQRMDAYELRQALQFLNNCGLITITYVSSSFDTKPYVVRDLLNGLQDVPKREVFNNLNISIKYPMFYVDLLEGILKDRFPEKLPRELLGSVVENHVRAILPDTGCFEYHDAEDREIDYVRNSIQQAIEVSISNKDISSTNFDILPSGYQKILLTKDIEGKKGDVQCVPYYRFIFNNSVGKDLWLQLSSTTNAKEPDQLQPNNKLNR